MNSKSTSESTVDSTRNLTTRVMSEEDFVAWISIEVVRAEWVNGEVDFMSPVALKHVQISSWLHRVLGLYIETIHAPQFYSTPA